MEMVSIRQGDGQTLRLTREGAIVIPAPYRIEVEPASGIYFDPIKTVHGWRGVLMRGDRRIASGDTRFGARDKSRARLDAQNLKRRHETYFRLHARYLEDDRRAEVEALRQARDESTARRKAFTADRVALWRMLSDMTHLAEAHRAAKWAEAAALIEKHRQAVDDIANDPGNNRGGAPEAPARKPVLAGGRRR